MIRKKEWYMRIYHSFFISLQYQITHKCLINKLEVYDNQARNN